MAKWTKHFQSVATDRKIKNALMARHNNSDGGSGGTGSKFASFLPEVYAGHPLRIERYNQYDQMDSDSEVNASLDTIADFSTKRDPDTNEMFNIDYIKDVGDSEIEALKIALLQWTKVNDFKRRLWRMFRSTLKYGDQFFVRDPETMKWFWIDPAKVEKVLVNEAEGKSPEAYLIRDLDLNLQSLTATAASGAVDGSHNMPGFNAQWQGSQGSQGGLGSRNSRFNEGNQSITAVDAAHVVHLSLSEGLDANWPFGTSILESVFMVFRQKQLLEDAVIIYRIQRAPERRVYYVDVGGMPPHRAGAYLERMKNEMNQRRFPSRNGGGQSVMDAAYNPMSMMEDIFFAQTPDGRGSRVDTLPGGESLGQIDDLRYFDNKLKRGLRVPSSYLPTGPEDGIQTYNDGRTGTAYIQEFRFAEYCSRLQNLLSPIFDEEFKLFAKRRGLNVDASTFELNFNAPENFGTYAMIELMASRINIYQPLSEDPSFSNRYLKKFMLGMTDEQIMDNERMWAEENPEAIENIGDGGGSSTPAGMPGLEGVGIRPQEEDEGMDLGDNEEPPEIESGDPSPISGDESTPDEET